MSRKTEQSTGRNALCPCGSGRKFKRCCEGRTWTRDDHGRRRQWFNPFTVMIVAVFVGALGVWGVNQLAGTTSEPHSATPAAGAPEPWEYDAENNRYFDPRPDHGHWHPGTPPPEHQR